MNLKEREKTGSSILQKSHLLRSLSKNMNSVNVSVPDFATKYRKPKAKPFIVMDFSQQLTSY